MNRMIDFLGSERALFADGEEFGKTGSYERLTGKISFFVDPKEVRNASIVDLSLAPTNEDGLVRYHADFCILKPVDLGRGNRRLLFEFVNRGNKRILQFFNDARPGNMPAALADAGNGFLMREGYTIAWLGWQGDMWPGNDRVILEPPVAKLQGAPVTGEVFSEFISSSRDTKVFPLSAATTARSYPAASGRGALTRRRFYDGERETIAENRWSFSRIEGGLGGDNQGAEIAVIPSDSHIYLPDGFEPGWIYELVYTAKDPFVLGLGHVAARDFISFLKHGLKTASGLYNPLHQSGIGIEKAYAWGRSQSGRCIRDFIYLGFNEDLDNRQVFEGVMPHVAGAGKMWMNQRFARPTLLPGQSYENHTAPADRFPFSYARTKDHITGREDAILKKPDSDPFVIHTDSAAEYWHRRASLVHTDTQGKDLLQPEKVRIYFWSSSQHWASPLLGEPSTGLAQTYLNVVATSMFFRAVLVRLDNWVTKGIAPPESRIPRRQDGTLVDDASWRKSFPAIPGVATPSGPSRLERMDYGERIDEGLLECVPPRVMPGQEYAVLVPATDSDGNDRAGVRAPMVQAPLGTYTGWSMRKRGHGHGAMIGITGSYIPFSETSHERRMTNDPRPAALERFPDSKHYVDAIRAAAEALVAQGFMLDEDVPRCVALAANWGRPRHVISLPE